jgi:hypothetical protein
MKMTARVITLVVLACGLAALTVRAQQSSDAGRVTQQLIGSYKLISYVSYDANGAATTSPNGCRSRPGAQSRRVRTENLAPCVRWAARSW